MAKIKSENIDVLRAENYWFKVPGEDNIDVSPNGEIRKKTTTGYKLVAQYIKHGKNRSNGYYCKINCKETKVAHLVYKTFIGDIPEGKVISHRDGYIWNNQARNLVAMDRAEVGRITGPKSRSKVVEKIDKKGFVVATYRSARDAGRQNFMSYQTVLDRCNGKVKYPFRLWDYDFRFQED